MYDNNIIFGNRHCDHVPIHYSTVLAGNINMIVLHVYLSSQSLCCHGKKLFGLHNYVVIAIVCHSHSGTAMCHTHLCKISMK